MTRDRGGKFFRRLQTALSRPLLIAQILASASGAIAMVMAATVMESREFTLFALISLAAMTLVGLIRAILFQPALIEMRHDKNAFIPFRYAIAGAITAGVLLGVAAFVFGASDAAGIALLAVSGLFPVLHDWLRFRAMGLDRRWQVVVADGLRLVSVLAGPLILMVTTSAVAFQAYLGFSLVLPVAVLLCTMPRVRSYTPFSAYARAASLQATDFVVGQFTSTLPLMVLGGLGPSALIAGVRFAQTLLGPLNLVYAASTMNLIADGALSEAHGSPGHLIRAGRRLGRMLGGLALGIAPVMAGLAWATSFELRGVDNRALVAGLLIVGFAMLTSGWAGIHATILRIIGHHAVVTLGRTLLVIVSLSAFGLGYAVGGVDASLVAGFVATGIASPLAFVVPASVIFRRYRDDGAG